MASNAALDDQAPPNGALDAALQHIPWRRWSRLSSVADATEKFLAGAGFDRAPWLAVAFAGGIAGWFLLPTQWHWLALLAACLATCLSALALLREDGRFAYVRQALMVVPLMAAAGCLTVWAKSAIVGETAIEGPRVVRLTATVIAREEQPAEQRVRLVPVSYTHLTLPTNREV